ncbi:hypothetical protein D9M69_731660 [compost metagenome]
MAGLIMPAMVITSATLPLLTSDSPWRSCSTGPSQRPRRVMKAAYDTQAKHSRPSVCGMAKSGSSSRTALAIVWRSCGATRGGSCTRQNTKPHDSIAKPARLA